MRDQESLFFNFFSLLASFCLCYWIKDEPFFWDTIQLGAMHGDWFFQQNFTTILLPDSIDSGHIPAFGWYLALIWKVFGQNLLVSHLAMVPWVYLLLSQLHVLIKNTLSKSVLHQKPSLLSLLFIGILFFLADPVLLSQMTLISPDVILVGAFLLGMNSILNDKKWVLMIAIALLGLISMRGIMVAIALFIWQLSHQIAGLRKQPFITIKKTLLSYLPAAFLVIFYLAFHYHQKGWIGLHDNSPWAESFATVGISGLIKQLVVFAWRMLDFGRVFVWFSLGILLLLFYKKRLLPSQSLQNGSPLSFATLAFILALILGTPAIISAGLSQHRYFLPLFIVLNFLFLQLLLQFKSTQWKKGLWLLAFIGLLSGNMWVYPNEIAQGWDASLAHKFYFDGKKQLKKYLSEENILLSETGSVFPEVGPEHFRLLNNNTIGFQPLDMDQQQYVFYSNIMNDFSDEQLIELGQQWKRIFTYQKQGVNLVLYQAQ